MNKRCDRDWDSNNIFFCNLLNIFHWSSSVHRNSGLAYNINILNLQWDRGLQKALRKVGLVNQERYRAVKVKLELQFRHNPEMCSAWLQEIIWT